MPSELPPLVEQLVGDAGDLYRTLSAVESVLDDFASKEWNATLDVNWTAVAEGIAAAEAAADDFASKTYDAKLDIDASEALLELAAFLRTADSMRITIPVTLDMGVALAQLATLTAAAQGAGGGGGLGIGVPVGAGGGGGGGLSPTALATIAASSAAGSGNNGGGGGAGLAAALGFGAAGSGGIGRGGRFLGPIGGGLAGFGTLGSLAGLGPESLLTTIAGVGGSALGGLAGGAALGLGALGVSGVGLGTDMAGMGQAAKDAQSYTQALNALNRAIAVYGAGSIQAKAATYDLNNLMNALTPAAQKGVIALSQAGQQFHTVFDQLTGQAEAAGAQILTQIVGVAQKFLPTIGAFASQNMDIIRNSLQPLMSWLQGPGLAVFNELEAKFSSDLPTAMHAFDQGVELLIRTLGFLAPYTGNFIAFLDDLFTKLNGSGWDGWTHDLSTVIGIFRDWEGLIKSIGTAIYELFHHDAGTGSDLVVELTNMINKFNAWAQTTAGGDSLHSLLVSHRDEIMAIVGIIGQLISTWGQLEVAVRPVLQFIVAGLADVVNFLMQIPGLGQLAGLVIAFEILGKHIGLIGTLLSPFNAALKSLIADGLIAVGSAISGLGGPFATLGGWLGGMGDKMAAAGTTASEAMSAAAADISAAAADMSASASLIAESFTGVGAAATTMTTEIDAAMTTAAADAEASSGVIDTAIQSMAVSAASSEAGVASAMAGIAESLQSVGATATEATATTDAAISSIAADIDLTETQVAAAAAGIAEALQGIGVAATEMAATVDTSMASVDAAVASSGGAAAIAGGTAAGGGAAAAAGGTAIAGGEAAAGGALGLTTLTAGLAIALPAVLGVELGKLFPTTDPFSGLGKTAVTLPMGGNDPTQLSQSLDKLTQQIVTQANKSPIGGLTPLGWKYTTQNLPSQIPNLQQLNSQQGPNPSPGLEASLTKYQQITTALNNVKTNTAELANITGFDKLTGSAQNAIPFVQNLANTLGVNLQQALTPQTVEQFTKYLDGLTTSGKLSDGAAKEMEQQWQDSADKTAAALSVLDAKAAVAMPGISKAAQNMIAQVNPSLIGLVTTMQKSGDSGGAAFVAGILAHLSPAQLASKNMHDAVNSPLIPLETELRQIGDTAGANAIAAFIAKVPAASNASKNLHDAIINPMQDIEAKLSAVGDSAGAGLIQAFLKHNPEANTASGLMHDAVTGKLDPLIQTLLTIGDTAGANYVAGLVGQEVAAKNAGTTLAGAATGAMNGPAMVAAAGQAGAAIANAFNTAVSKAHVTLPGWGAPAPTPTTPTNTHVSVPKTSASGNILAAGEVSWVGEDGPELFVSGYSGAILPVNMNSGGGLTSNALTGAGGGGFSTGFISNLQSVFQSLISSTQTLTTTTVDLSNSEHITSQDMATSNTTLLAFTMAIQSAITAISTFITNLQQSVTAAAGVTTAAADATAAVSDAAAVVNTSVTTSAATLNAAGASPSGGFGINLVPGQGMNTALPATVIGTSIAAKGAAAAQQLIGSPVSGPGGGIASSMAAQIAASAQIAAASNVAPIAPVASQFTGGSFTTVLSVNHPIQINGQTLANVVQQYMLRGGRATGNIFGGFAGGNQTGVSTGLNVNAVQR